MAHATTVSTLRRPISGRVGIGVLYAALYGLNYWLPFERSNQMTRNPRDNAAHQLARQHSVQVVRLITANGVRAFHEE